MGGTAKLPDGRLAFGGKGGVTIFHPDDLVADTARRGDPDRAVDRWCGSTAGDEGSPLEVSIPETEVLTLTHRQSTFAIEFSGLGARNPEGNRYRFQLEGVDPGWTEVDASVRQARYTNLDAGEYPFTVHAGNRDEIWTEQGATLMIRVLPPWWLTVWAYALYALALIGGFGRLRQLAESPAGTRA